jgi:hypothetical protein
VVDKVTSKKSKYAVDVQGLTNAPIYNLRLTNCTFDNVAEGAIVKNVQNATIDKVRINGKEISKLASV